MEIGENRMSSIAQREFRFFSPSRRNGKSVVGSNKEITEHFRNLRVAHDPS